MMACRSASLIVLQALISLSVRPQPVQWCRVGSSVQIEAQGVETGIGFGTLKDAARR